MVLALDIGGTNIRSAIVKGSKISQYKKTKTPGKQKEVLEKLFEVIESYGPQKEIGVSTAGFERNGKIVNSLNNDMDGAPLTKLLKKRYPKSTVFVENDANCAALAEFYYGAGKGKKNFILLTLGSGIGCGGILNGNLYRGQGGAVEAGSMRIEGEKYIWEDIASGDGSVFLARKAGLKLNSLDLERMADKGDKRARKIYEGVGKYLGIGITNLAYIFDPELVIIGGGFSRVKHIYLLMEKTFLKLYKLRPAPKIVKAKFGDDAGLIGAGLLSKEK